METGSKRAASELDQFTLTVAISLLIILITFVYFWLNKKSSRKSILLVGLADAGKTVLFSQLAHGTFVETVTSMRENEEQMEVKGRKLALLDLPGFERLRSQFWEKFKPRARAMIYVVDSVAFMTNVHNVADLLYQYLSDDFVMANRIPCLIACTKQDESRAKTSKAIFSLLEKEFNTIRETRMGALDSTGGDQQDQVILGNPSHVFAFSDLRNKVDFVDCSASESNKNLENVLRWIETIA